MAMASFSKDWRSNSDVSLSNLANFDENPLFLSKAVTVAYAAI